MTLQAKLRPSGVPDAETERHHEAMLTLRQAQRRRLGSERQRHTELSDQVYAIVQLTSLQRRGGLIEASGFTPCLKRPGSGLPRIGQEVQRRRPVGRIDGAAREGRHRVLSGECGVLDDLAVHVDPGLEGRVSEVIGDLVAC
ncbi:hypothetical protein [Streptomyces chartreusis]|uniref:hypothetical protein n=1 Tax=Streptomyces chartreusis TaxID=1969 RepID=UPI0037D81725